MRVGTKIAGTLLTKMIAQLWGPKHTHVPGRLFFSQLFSLFHDKPFSQGGCLALQPWKMRSLCFLGVQRDLP